MISISTYQIHGKRFKCVLITISYSSLEVDIYLWNIGKSTFTTTDNIFLRISWTKGFFEGGYKEDSLHVISSFSYEYLPYPDLQWKKCVLFRIVRSSIQNCKVKIALIVISSSYVAKYFDFTTISISIAGWVGACYISFWSIFWAVFGIFLV